MSTMYPRIVNALINGHNAWIVGSAANPEKTEPRDIDVLVPFSEWYEAAFLIPDCAKPNSFGGWKFTTEGIEVDVWPGDIAVVMAAPKCEWVYHHKTGRRWRFWGNQTK